MKILQVIFLISLISCLGQGMKAYALSLQERQQLKSLEKMSAFSGTLAASFDRSNDQYDDGQYTLSGLVSYSLSQKSKLSLTSSYSVPLSTYEENMSDRWEDTSILFQIFEIGNVGPVILDAQFFATAPSSDTSRDASLIVSGGSGIRSRMKLLNWMNLSTSHSVQANYYEFETADKAGDVYNSPYSLTNAIQFFFRISSKLGLNLGGFHFFTERYSGTSVNIHGLTASMDYSFLDNYSMTLSGSWRDRSLTNNSIFDDDTTSVGAGIAYRF